VRNQVGKFCGLLILALLPAATGCAGTPVSPLPEGSSPDCSRSTENYLTDRLKWDRIPNIRQCWIDRCGHLYPDPAVCRIDPSRLRNGGFCVKKCLQETGTYDVDAVCRSFADQIDRMCSDGSTLVILIHGFNHAYEEIHYAYKGARNQIQARYPGRKFSYLEVYWDGYYGDPFAVWPLAQVSSKWAGLGLRRLLGQVDPRIPMRVITHSRGASVICAALWNTPMRGKVDEDRLYREAQAACPPPVLTGIRLGLLAPAMRAADFEAYFDRGEAPAFLHDRVILGINPDDAALKAGGLSWLAGSSLGCSPELFETSVAPLLNRGRAHAFAVDFSGSAFHAFAHYVLRDTFESEFLPLLLDDQDPV